MQGLKYEMQAAIKLMMVREEAIAIIEVCHRKVTKHCILGIV